MWAKTMTLNGACIQFDPQQALKRYNSKLRKISDEDRDFELGYKLYIIIDQIYQTILEIMRWKN